MFSFDHAEFMSQFSDIWALLNYNNYLTYFLTIMCVAMIVKIVINMIRPEDVEDDG